MTNQTIGDRMPFASWLNHDPDMAQGFVDYDNGRSYKEVSPAYELGRQLAILAEQHGIRRTKLVRKAPNQDYFRFVKTQAHEVGKLAVEAGFFSPSSPETNFCDL